MIWLGVVATLIVLLTIKTRMTQHTLSVEMLKILKIIEKNQLRINYLSQQVELLHQTLETHKSYKKDKYETYS